MENLELDVDTFKLRNAVIHRLDDSCDGGEGDGAEGDEALERAECDRDHFGGFRRAAHEYRAKEVFHAPAIFPSKKSVSTCQYYSSVSPCAKWRDVNISQAKLAVTI